MSGRWSGGIFIHYKNLLKDFKSIVDTNKNGIMLIKIDQKVFSHYTVANCIKLG